MSTGCDRYEDRLLAYAAGTLAAEERARLETHVAECVACRDELAVAVALRTTAPAPPAGLEARIQRAVRAAAAPAAPAAPATPVAPATPTADGQRAAGTRRAWWPGRPAAGRSRKGRGVWRPVALPLAAAAALAAVWVTAERPWAGSGDGALEALAAEEYHPYGTLPAGDGVVAGELVLSELSVEDLERLLEEME